jgi:hypothetical protein
MCGLFYVGCTMYDVRLKGKQPTANADFYDGYDHDLS